MNNLHPDHPDADKSPKDEYDNAEGDTWVFGQNQYTKFWRNRPKDGTVVCSRDYPHGSDSPYLAGGRGHKTLPQAIEAARKAAKKEYERALEIVRRYEAETK